MSKRNDAKEWQLTTAWIEALDNDWLGLVGRHGGCGLLVKSHVCCSVSVAIGLSGHFLEYLLDLQLPGRHVPAKK